MKKTPEDMTKAVIKKYTVEEGRSLMRKIARVEADPEYILEKLANDILPKYMSGSPEEKEGAWQQLKKEGGKVLMALGLETHMPLAEAADKHYQPYAMEVVVKMIKEYECKAVSEIALCDVAVNSYIKVLAYTRRFKNCMDAGEHITENRTKYLAVLSKELDRANRQFLAAFSMLRQIKSPAIAINVKTKTAIFGQNQQFNAAQEAKADDPQ